MPRARLQIDIEEDKMKELEALMHDCGIATKRALFNDALTLFKWAVNKRKKGFQIGAMGPDGRQFTELETPALSHVCR